MGELLRLPTVHEPWLSKAQLALQLGVSKRKVEYLMADGLPSRLFCGRRQFRLSVVESWLRDHGYEEGG